MKIVKTAWRNIGRNRGRTTLSATAIFFSALVICMAVSFEKGFIDDMKTNVTNHVTGDIRVMNGQYVLNERITPLQFFIDDTPGALAAAASDPSVDFATPKSDFAVSIYRSGEQIPSRAMGIDFASSPVITAPNNRLVEGTLPEAGSAQVLITVGLASELSLAVGSRFTAITRTAISGSNGKTFTVSGILSLADTDFSNRVFFMDWNTAGQYLRMNGNALQIQVFLKKGMNETAASASIETTLKNAGHGGLDIRPWFQVSSLYRFFTLAEVIYAFIGAMFYLMASTVIFNTTMMSVLERKKEIGTLMALGMEKRRLISLFLVESGMIAAVGAAAGTFAGFLLVSALGRFGIDFSKMGGASLKGMSVSQVVYPSLAAVQYLYIFLLGIAVSLAACYLPARMVARVEPADALADR